MNKFLTSLLLTSAVAAYTPTNLDNPYDFSFSEQNWRPEKGWVHIGTRGEYMVKERAFDPDQKSVPATQIWGKRHSALAMLEGHQPGTTLHSLANQLRGAQDGTRGTFEPTGSFHRRHVIFDVMVPFHAIRLPGLFSLSAHLPLCFGSFSNVRWVSKTAAQTLQDELVKSSLASDHQSLTLFAQKHGNLNIEEQSREGFGDAVIMLNWQGHFSQYQRRLKDVRVQARVGVKLPTGLRNNINKAFEVDFGHDGAFGVPLGAGLRLDLGGGVRVGLDVGALLLIRRTKEWRLLTGAAQNENLLLTTGKATREFGPEWKFTLYSQLYNNRAGLAATVGYQFLKHTDSTLYPQSNALSSLMVNSGQSTEVSESHNVVGAVTFTPAVARGWRVRPELQVVAKYPFGGTRMASGTTLGGSVSVRF